MMRKRDYTLGACLVLLLAGFIVCPAMAVTITESPSSINTGETIHVSFTGLSDGSSVSIRVDGEFEVI